MQRLGHVAALDGLRGIAIAFVLAGHFLGWPSGGRGVDLFFVLSGFLITTLLLEERERGGRILLRRFYVRRCRRLLPALAAMLCFFAVVEAARGVDPIGDLVRYGLYGANFYIAYVAHDAHSPALSHLWSLAEEEQFYLVWPLVLVLLTRTRRLLATILVAYFALTFYRATLVFDGHWSWWTMYYTPQMHSTGLLAGAGAAVLRRRGFQIGQLPAIAAAGLGVLVLLGPSDGVFFAEWLPVFELAGAAVMLAAVSLPGWQLLGVRPLGWLGRISYSLYLWHVPLLWLFHDQDRLLVFVLSLVAAAASYNWIEQPFRQRRSSGQMTCPVELPATSSG